MGNDSIDNMIENWSKGLGSGTREKVDAKAQGDLSTWAAPSPSPAPSKPGKAPSSPSHRLAADAIRKEIGDGRGPKKGMWTYRNVVRDALGLKRLSTKVFEAVLQLGYGLGIFELDDNTLKYPFLVGLDYIPESEIEVKPEPEPKPEPKPEPPVRKSFSENPPEDWRPQGWMVCGHPNYQSVPKTLEEMTDAEKKRVQGAVHSFIHPYKTLYFTTPKDCPACGKKERGNPQHQKGEHRTSMAMAQRRTTEKEDGLGFPGLCADPESGFYIGGLGNDCRRYHTGPERCVVHARPPRTPSPDNKRKTPSVSRKEEPSK